MPDKNVYIFLGESYMVKMSVRRLVQSLDISNEQMNIVDYREMPKADEIIGACAEVPFMSEKRLIIVWDCSVLRAKGSAEEAKKIAAYIDNIPDETVLVLCSNSADKRRALFKQIKKIGHVAEFAAPKQAECVEFVIARAKIYNAQISRKTAAELTAIAGYDYYALDNEVAKLAIYSENKEITSVHVEECASKTLEYNVFEIHGLFVSKQAAKARELLADILKAERPEALIGLFARKIRDMYKVKMMLNARYSLSKIATQLKIRSFVAEIISRECKRFSGQELRYGLRELANLDYAIKSGEKDASLALPEALVKIYKL